MSAIAIALTTISTNVWIFERSAFVQSTMGDDGWMSKINTKYASKIMIQTKMCELFSIFSNYWMLFECFRPHSLTLRVDMWMWNVTWMKTISNGKQDDKNKTNENSNIQVHAQVHSDKVKSEQIIVIISIFFYVVVRSLINKKRVFCVCVTLKKPFREWVKYK